MKRKYLHTLIALVVLALMWAGFTYWDKHKSSEPAKSDTTTNQEKLLAVESSHIQSLTIKPRDGEAITCRREGGNWVIVEPKKVPADSNTVSSLLSSLTGATIGQVVDAKPANLKNFGLDTPSATLQVLTDAKPAQFTLSLGDETPTSGEVYAQVAGNPRVVTLASYLKTSLVKNLFDLRDKRIITLSSSEVQRIEVDAKGKRWTIAKNPEGVWDLVLPPAVRADRFTVEGIVNRLQNATMQSVAAEDKKDTSKYGFGAPELSVKVIGPGVTQTLVVGKKEKEKYYAVNSALDPVFTLESTFPGEFEKSPDDLRDKNLFSFSTFDVKKLEVETPGGKRTFERQKENKWKQTAPGAKDEPTDKVEALINHLRDLRADSFPAGDNMETYGLQKPAYRFKAQFGEKNETETVEAAKVGEHVYARRPTDARASEVPKNTLDDIEKALKEL
ncbi:MAG: DUF4340 domain-containing protein [Terriglobia bacterium]